MKLFDRIAERVSAAVAHGWFFGLCLAFVVGWVLLLPVEGVNNEILHLWLNSPTTSVTFLLVALLQNSSRRDSLALHRKLDALLEELGREWERGIEADTSA